jgi:hypothetical protein
VYKLLFYQYIEAQSFYVFAKNTIELADEALLLINETLSKLDISSSLLMKL